MNTKITRRTFLIGFSATALGTVVDMNVIEPRWLKLSNVDVSLRENRLIDPIKILHVSDMHFSKHVSIDFIKKAFELGTAQHPDVVFITGDFISRRVSSWNEYVEALSLLSSTCPCFACVGNHDGGQWVGPKGGYKDLTEIQRLLEESGISLLCNSAKTTTIKQNSIEIIGIGDYWSGNAKPGEAFSSTNTTNSMTRVVLSHNPDSKELLDKYAWDLMLCGHTHGGQLSLPIIGTPFAPVQDHRYVYGLNPWNGRLIHTTSGIGNVSGLRFNCRPEIAMLHVS